MRIESLVIAIKAAQFSAMEQTFKTPPQSFEDFKQRLGFYSGLNSVLNMIEEERSKDGD